MWISYFIKYTKVIQNIEMKYSDYLLHINIKYTYTYLS